MGSGQLGVPTILTRSYFSSHYLWAAKHLAGLAGKTEEGHTGSPRFDIGHRAYVVNSIMSSVAFLEAAINELYQDAFDGHESYIGLLPPQVRSLLGEFWAMIEGDSRPTLSILDKLELPRLRGQLMAWDFN